MKIRFVLKTFTFLFFMHPQTSKSVTSLQILPHIRSYTFINFFKSLRIIKMKFDQILVQLMTNISNSFSALLPTLETSSRPSHDFHKIAVQCNLLISSGWRLLFLIAFVHTFQRINKLAITVFYLWLVG